MATTDLGPLIVTGLFTLAAALAGAGVAQKFQADRDAASHRADLERDRYADERSIRDRKADRLRGAYRDLLTDAHELRAQTWLWRSRAQALARLPPAARHAEATELMRTARQSLDRSQIAVLLESEFHASDVWNLQQSMVGASRDYLGNLLEEGEKPGSVSDDAQEAILDRIEEDIRRLSEIARSHLAELEKPL